MDQFKSIFASKTVWVSFLGLLASTALGAKWLAGVDIGQLSTTIALVIDGLCSILAMFFRAQATAQVVTSPTVAQVANMTVAQGSPPDQALKAAKRVVSGKK